MTAFSIIATVHNTGTDIW